MMSFIAKWRYSTILPASVNNLRGIRGPEPAVLSDKDLADGTLAVYLAGVAVSGAPVSSFKPAAAAG